MNEKYVQKPIKEIPIEEELKMQRPELDLVTKPKGSLNSFVQKNQERINWQKKRKEAELNNRNLNTIEKDAEQLIAQERVINLDKRFIENLRRVFVKSKAKGEEHSELVLKETFFDNLCFDDYFEPILETTDIRETVDGERETLDHLLFRVDKEH